MVQTQWQWRIQGGGDGGGPYFFTNKSPFLVQKAYGWLCAFAIDDDGTDTLSSAR